MKLTSRSAASFALMLMLVLAHAAQGQAARPPACADAGQPDKPFVIRVGVVAYDDFGAVFDRYKKLLTEVAKDAKRQQRLGNRQVVFRLALGSYTDVYEWYGRGLVDLAFLTPTLISNLRTTLRDAEGAGRSDAERERSADARLAELYVASHDSEAIYNEGAALLHAVKPNEQPRFDYRAMAAVRKDSPLRGYDDLRREAERGNVRFLFVDPLSASGRVLPEFFLRHQPEAGRRIENFTLTEREGEPGGQNQPSEGSQNGATYTFSPKASIDELSKPARSESSKHQVAFFSQRNLDDERYAGYGLRRLDIPELEAVDIPDQALFISHGFLANKPCVESLFDVHDPQSRFQQKPNGRDWLARFGAVFEWVSRLNISATDKDNQLVTLDQIADVLRTYEERHKRPARLALVLSGGGAKCAYQIGAIEALESELGKPPDEGERAVDIDLVVGTSGGAINALTVALGLTRDEGGDIGLVQDTWKDFSQRDFFSPWPIPYFILGVCSGLLQALLVIWGFILLVQLVRLFAAGRLRARFGIEPQDFYRASGFVVALLAILNLAVWVTRWNGMPFSTTSHLWHHAWLLLTINMLVSGLCLAVVAGFMIFRVLRGKFDRRSLGRLHLVIRNVFAFGLVTALLLGLLYQDTVSRSDGVDEALLKKLALVVDSESDGMRAALAKEDKKDRFREVSRIIREYLQRDLIITGSRLSVADKKGAGQSEDAQPSDLYFYYDHPKCGAAKGRPVADACDPDAPATDKRFRPFAAAGDNLMDVVVGSSSIYPIFPARPLDDNLKIIDGGFAHNSPIDAAVTWGATHIILIEASPKVTPQESRLLYNALNAFNHLYYQAQLLDARARGKVEIFTLRPEPSESEDEPDLCTFDFHPKLVELAIDRGRDDAIHMKPRFRRESGEPVLREVGVDEFTDRPVECPCEPDADLATTPHLKSP
jgi:predicted acylesterase/phospholipase RssA/ABC-type phosphate/phosphonate transport system substrate-binding protein